MTNIQTWRHGLDAVEVVRDAPPLSGLQAPMQGAILSMAISMSPLVATKSPHPKGRSQAFVDGPPALVRASFIR
jgi:hypothetical protein